MADLIDRAELLAAGNVRKMKDALEDWDTLDNKTKIIVLRYAKAHKKLVEHAPAVDAVEVVRCKDCIHMENSAQFRHCRVWGAINGMGDEGFCNYGERRRDATN